MKVGIRTGSVVALLRAPDGVDFDLPPGITVKRRAVGSADVVVYLVTRAGDLEPRIDGLAGMVRPAGGLWIARPKRSSGIASDMSDHLVRDLALGRGLVDNKVCAVDATWTALRIVWRLDHR
jgi:hypothetical protein